MVLWVARCHHLLIFQPESHLQVKTQKLYIEQMLFVAFWHFKVDCIAFIPLNLLSCQYVFVSQVLSILNSISNLY